MDFKNARIPSDLLNLKPVLFFSLLGPGPNWVHFCLLVQG